MHRKGQYHMDRFLTNYTLDIGLISKIHKEFKKSRYPKNQITQLKMGLRSRQKILRKNTQNGCETLKELFTIYSNQGNVNQKYIEISSHTLYLRLSIKEMMTCTGDDMK